MPDHKEHPASALAHGAAKSSDITRVRRDLAVAELRAARDLQAAARRHRRESARRAHEPH